MAPADNVSVDVTNSVLDQLVPPYFVTSDYHPIKKLSPGYEIVRFPSSTPETQQSGVIQINSGPLEIADLIGLPAIQTLGRARLKVRSVSRLSLPSFD